MSDAIDVHLGRLLDAARREGIDPASPLGEWMQALVSLTTAVQHRIAGVVDAAKAAADAEVERTRAAADQAQAAARRAEAAIKALEVRTEEAQTQAIEKLTPAVAEALGQAMVIRERRHNTTTLLVRVAIGSTLALGFVGAGYGLRAAADRHATALYDRCLRATVKGSDGRIYCPVEALRDPAGTNQDRRQH